MYGHHREIIVFMNLFRFILYDILNERNSIFYGRNSLISLMGTYITRNKMNCRIQVLIRVYPIQLLGNLL